MFSRNQTTKLNTCFLKAPYSLTIKRKNILNKTLSRLPIPWYPLWLSTEEAHWTRDVLLAHLQGVWKWKQLRFRMLKSYQNSNHELGVPSNMINAHFWNRRGILYLFIWDRRLASNLFWFPIQMSTVNGIMLLYYRYIFGKVCDYFNLKAMDSKLEELWPCKILYK